MSSGAKGVREGEGEMGEEVGDKEADIIFAVGGESAGGGESRGKGKGRGSHKDQRL